MTTCINSNSYNSAQDIRLPLLSGQKALWHTHQFSLENNAFSVGRIIHIPEKLDKSLLGNAVIALQVRHPQLRATFHFDENGNFQLIHNKPLSQLVWLENALNFDETIKMLQGISDKPFDLQKGPLIRFYACNINEKNVTLLICAHNIITDYYSFKILTEELRLYITNQSSNLPVSPGFFDFINKEKHYLNTEKAKIDLNYLQSQVENIPILELPIDYPRPKIRNMKGHSQSLELNSIVRQKVLGLSKKHHLEPSDLFLGIFTILLSRYSNQDDFAIGIGYNLRDDSEMKHSAGFFSNDVPLHISLKGNSSFSEYVASLNKLRKEIENHAFYPFISLIDNLSPQRDISRHPVFQTYFSWYDENVEKPWKIFPIPQEEGQFDIACAIHDLQDSLKIYFRYSSNLFHPKSIFSMLSRFDYLTQQIISNPEILINKLSILKPSEYEELFHESEVVSIHQMDKNCIVNNLFEEQVKKHASETAVFSGNKTLTYSELNKQSNKLANFLINNFGAKKGTRIGLYIDRSHYLITGLLAILKTGGIYVPLDPSFPSDRIDYMVKDSNIEILLTISDLKNSLSFHSNKMVCIDNNSCGFNESSVEDPKIDIQPNDSAYIIYTSGSTGLPKGVEIFHGSLYNFIVAMSKEPGLSEGDVFCAITTFSFDISLLELLGPISTGGTCVILNHETAIDASALASAIDIYRPDIIQATPATWRMIIESGWKKQKDYHLRILCGGEQISSDLAKELLLHTDELWNMYGPTETTIWSTCNRLNINDAAISAGKAISNTTLYILDNTMQPLPWGIPGNLYIGGVGVARGYVNKQKLTSDKFITDPFSRQADTKLYATGDRARLLCNGELEILGRVDSQIKLHGFRIEPGEIETVLKSHPEINNAIVNIHVTNSGDSILAAHLTTSISQPAIDDLRNFCNKKLPSYMIPSAFFFLNEFPLTPNGKIDRKALLAIDLNNNTSHTEKILPGTEAEEKIASLWKELLSLEHVGIHDNFFDLGATSITASIATPKLKRLFNTEDFSVLNIFSYPTINALAQYFTDKDKSHKPVIKYSPTKKSNNEAIAIIGMAGRFPEAANIEDFWKNLCDGRETVSFFTPEELHPSIPWELRNDPSYVGARGILDDIDKFDAAFFGIRPKEAQIMDPQQRIFLETAWAALENAGYSSDKCKYSIGVYAGMGNNTYFTNNVFSNTELIDLVGDIIIEIGTEKDHIAPRISYAMNLHGPSLSIHTACSTTLVVVDHAFHALRSNQCDMAIVGGIDIHVPQKSGRLYQDGGIFTRDGHCRPFDVNASGTMFGEGSGAVVLKRLDDALADNDTIYATIIGSAVNHDGSRKVSYLAPSSEGQTEVILKAISVADIHPETIGYIETHGTATPIGDPIEIEGLTNAFRLFTPKKQFCAIGSVKGNWGHATTAAGIVSLIKTTLIMKYGVIPPSINFSNPNTHIDFDNSPFFINTHLKPWPSNSSNPRRAAVSSFGFCGTNAHVILQEFPKQSPSSNSRPIQLFLFSAKTDSSLSRITQTMSDFIKNNRDINLADAAYTLQVGRNDFPQRAFYISSNNNNSVPFFSKTNSDKCGYNICNTGSPQVVFLFPGQGSQYINMGINFYKNEPLFKQIVDNCADILKPFINRDIRDILYPENVSENAANDSLKKTFYTQPSIFTIEYALANLWMSWGVKPSALIGHSIGEFVCACLSGVFSLEDALMLVATRGKLMQDIMPGAMLSVRTSQDELKNILPNNLSLAAVNGPKLCVISGSEKAVSDFEKFLNSKQILCKYLHSSHAFHSYMMDPVIAPFKNIVHTINLRKPEIPIISSVEGNWMTDKIATSPDYWAKHMRQTVNFSDAIKIAWKEPSRILLESGPRATSATLASQHITLPGKQFAIPSLSDKPDAFTEWTSLLKAIGKLWLAGVSIDWQKFYKNEKRKRIPLPTYSFEKTSYWVEPANIKHTSEPLKESEFVEKESEMENKGQAENNKTLSNQLSEKLRNKISEISGLTLSETSDNDSFISLGLDSLVLTQIARAISHDYKVKIAFSNLMENIPTLKSLTEYIISEANDTISRMFQDKRQIESPDTTTTDTKVQNNKSIHKNNNFNGNPENSLLIRQMDIIERLLHLLETKEKYSKETIKIIENSNTPASMDKPLQNLDIIKMNNPPLPEARLGKDENGYAAWYIPDPSDKSNYIKMENNL